MNTFPVVENLKLTRKSMDRTRKRGRVTICSKYTCGCFSFYYRFNILLFILQDGSGLKKKKQIKKIKKHNKDLEVGVSEPSSKKQKKNAEKAKTVLDSIEPLYFKVT